MFSVMIAVLFLTAWTRPSAGQDLTRISATERSDGLGHVVRFHMESPADSFKLWQPDNKLIQLRLYKDNTDIDHILVFDPETPFQFIELHRLRDGIGVDIHLQDDQFMEGRVYPDANGRDLLVGLTRSTAQEINRIAQTTDRVNWNPQFVDDLDDTATWDIDDREFRRTMESYDFDDFDDLDFNGGSLKFDVVVIDPGHGGRDPGAIGHGGVYEKDITLAVALKLGQYIEEHLPDIKVVYTRDDDTFVGLEERGRIANEAQGDLFISLHANSNSNRHAQGAEVYFLGLHRSQDAFEVMKKENAVIRFEDEDERSEELTREQLVIYELANIGNIASSEVFAGLTERQFEERARRRSRGVKQAGFIVLYHASMPAILVELGFITNPQEQRFLSSEYGQSIMASAIFRAVRDYKEKIERSQNGPAGISR